MHLSKCCPTSPHAGKSRGLGRDLPPNVAPDDGISPFNIIMSIACVVFPAKRTFVGFQEFSLHCLIFPLFHVLWPALVKWLQRQIVFLLIFKMNPTRGVSFQSATQCSGQSPDRILPVFNPRNTQHNAITNMHIVWPSSSTLSPIKWSAGCTWDLNHTSLVPKYSLATIEPPLHPMT